MSGELLEAENLLKVLSYQKKTVVSRTILEKKTGTVTVFAFDRGEGLSEHMSPFEALVVILEGKAEISLGQQCYVLKKGDFLVLPAKKPHKVGAVERMKMLLVMVRSRDK
ncbi:MAG: cupin domain-containing protein [Candidatus Omnitrophica bacterium]|nr:cupin domain-containing protein [Candidatus Omnitrophota bacterium]